MSEASAKSPKPQDDPNVKGRRRARERWLHRRNEIVDVAAKLFADQGYSSTGIAQLGDVVGLGKGALYYYIGSKERLLSMIHDRVIERVLQSGADVEALDAPPAERLRILGIELLKIITEYPEHVWVFLHEWPALQGQEAAEFRRKRRVFEDTVERILVEGVESGDFKIPDTRIAVLAWLGMHNYTYQWFRAGGRLDAKQIAQRYYELFLDGIRGGAT